MSAWLAAILSALKAIPIINSWVERIILAFRKPIGEQIADARKKHDKALEDAEKNDKTDGLLGG